MIKTESEIYVVNERFDIVDESGYVVESYTEEQQTLKSWGEVEGLKDMAWCDAYVSAKNYIKEKGGNLTINRVLEVKMTTVQLVT